MPGGTQLRLLIVSSKIRNSNAFRSAVLPNVVFVQYKYESTSVEILGSKYYKMYCKKKMVYEMDYIVS